MAKALIIIDMINADVHSRRDKNKLIRNQINLIKAFKKRGHKIILTAGTLECKRNPITERLFGEEYKGSSKDPQKARRQEKYNIDVIKELKAEKPDQIIRKCEYSAFYETELEEYCKRNKINKLYFCGLSSGSCVYFTAVDALYRKIQPYLVIDASAAPNAKTHKQNIRKFKQLIGPTINSKELLKN